MITIVDYGMGNLGSICNMFKRIGTAVEVTSNVARIAAARKLLLPGVGAFDAAMSRIKERGLREVLDRKALDERIPVLGICLGMQLLCNQSEEGKLPGLGWIDADVRRFRVSTETPLKIPHMGWNTVDVQKPNPLIATDEGEQRYYFVHSYHADCRNHSDVLATAHYGYNFAAAVSRDNIMGVQFHPEKSHRFGLALMRRFVNLPCLSTA